MPLLIAVAGFLGAWLLVAGPVYQAAVELRGEAIDRAAVHEATSSVPLPPHASPWWWLLPPVALVKQQRAGRDYRTAVTAALPRRALEQWVHFNEKATGWLLVGAGGTLLALKETWELVESLRWAHWAFWPLVVGALLLSLLHTAAQMHRSGSALGDAEHAVPAAQG